MKSIRLGIVGAGFWAKYQIAGWRELGVIPVAICNRTKSKAQALATEFKIPHVYQDIKTLFENEKLDVVDIITSPDSHEEIVKIAASYHVPIICQKPMAPTFETAEQMVNVCKKANVPFMIHENWRWQTPIRALKTEIDSGKIGKIFRSRVIYCNSFPVFENQPFLKNLKQFILTDMGTHIFDVVRYLFGEVESLYCQTASVNPGIQGEDVATASLKMKKGLHCSVDMSYASILENEKFPQTYALIEGEKGSIKLGQDYLIKTTTKKGTETKQFPPPLYDWVDSKYAIVQSSIVDANRNFLKFLQGAGVAETTGEDNLKTLRLVYASYESAKSNAVIKI